MIQKEFNEVIVKWISRWLQHCLFQFPGPITRTRVSFHKITLSGYLLSGRTSSKYKIEWSKNPGKKFFSTYVSKIIVNIISRMDQIILKPSFRFIYLLLYAVYGILAQNGVNNLFSTNNLRITTWQNKFWSLFFWINHT